MVTPKASTIKMTPEELKKTYLKLSTVELLEIVDNKFDYTALAVSIALAELASREVSEQDINHYKDSQIEKAITFIKRNISDDLNLLQKNLFYFIWFPLINFAFKQNFRDDNYILKLKQANYYSLIGFLVFISTGVLSAIFNYNNLISFAIWIVGFIPAYIFDEKFNREKQINKLKILYDSTNANEENNIE